MYGKMQEHLQSELNGIREAGLFKKERVITTPQSAVIQTTEGKEVLNFCMYQVVTTIRCWTELD